MSRTRSNCGSSGTRSALPRPVARQSSGCALDTFGLLSTPALWRLRACSRRTRPCLKCSLRAGGAFFAPSAARPQRVLHVARRSIEDRPCTSQDRVALPLNSPKSVRIPPRTPSLLDGSRRAFECVPRVDVTTNQTLIFRRALHDVAAPRFQFIVLAGQRVDQVAVYTRHVDNARPFLVVRVDCVRTTHARAPLFRSCLFEYRSPGPPR